MAKRNRAACLAAIAFAATWATFPPTATAVTPRSPEVKGLVEKALGYLSQHSDSRLGGKCVIALAFLKADPPQPDHPRVKEAIQACAEQKQRGATPELDVYSNGLAIIFLCEHNPRAHRDLIDFFLKRLEDRQKVHGGWGYDNSDSGDTSQSQYAALSYWEAHNNGVPIEASSAERLANWLIKTQDPSGAWGYQGKLGEFDAPIEQEEITCSMVAAAMGSSLIAADLFGLLAEAGEKGSESKVPGALSVVGAKKRKRAPNLRSASFPRERLAEAIEAGNAWMDKNYVPDIKRYNVYYLYSLERYKSFQEKLDGDIPDEPQWYQDGFEYLRSKQGGNGSWSVGCGPGPDTAFGVLFLVRSTQKILQRGPIGDLRVGRRGFPKATGVVRLVQGEFVIKQTEAAVGELLNTLDSEAAEKLDALANDPTALVVVGEVDAANAQRLQQIVRGGEPAARLLAVRTLGRTGNLDYVPSLIFALTDPDKRVVLEARDALRFISRRFEGFGLPDRFDDKLRYTVIDRWKNWYLSIRPDAIVTLQ